MFFLRLTPVIKIGLHIVSIQAVFLLAISLLPKTLYAQAESITPERIITVVAEQPDAPAWKNLWDKARKSVRAEQLPTAVKLYEELFKVKSNIEAANWEFCQVLLRTGDFSSAAKIIISLVEREPQRIDYLLAAGTIALQESNYDLAIKYYGKVYEIDPGGIHSTTALTGLIDSLRTEGSYETLLPLLEQLHIRDPQNRSRLHELARMAEIVGQNSKAMHYYTKLLGMGPADDRVLFQAAEVFEENGRADISVPLWLEYIRRNPDFTPFRQKLSAYYLSEKNGMAALPHLLFLDHNKPGNDQLKVQIAKIYLHDAGRPDKALGYYEKYLEGNPEDQAVKAHIANIQSILANDFLSIVENDGAWMLWRDLMQVTPNRVAIYLKMAALLESKGKFKELLEILVIISNQNPNNDTINYKIVNLYKKKKEYGRAHDYLGKISNAHNSTKKHFLLKGDIEDLAGMEQKALVSYSNGLKIDLNDLGLREDCIARAGSLGLIEELEELFTNYPINSPNKQNTFFIINYLDQLAYNALFGRLADVYAHFLDVFKNDQTTLNELQFHRATTLRLEGASRKAEGLLRKLATHQQSQIKALFLLAQNAVEDKNIKSAREWYYAFEEKISVEVVLPEIEKELQEKKEFLKIKIIFAGGNVEDGVYLLTNLKRESLQHSKITPQESAVYKLEKELCWSYVQKGNYGECGDLLKELSIPGPFDPEIAVLYDIIGRQPGLKLEPLPAQYYLASGKQPILSRLLRVIQTELKHKQFNSAGLHLKTVLDTSIDSLAGRMFFAELSSRKGDLGKAIEIYQTAYEQYPKEKYFLKKWVTSENKQGHYRTGIAAFLKDNDGLKEIDSVENYTDLSRDFEEVLIFARMLWGDKQLEESLKVYKLLLNPPVIDLLGKKFGSEEIYSNYFIRERSFWNLLKDLLQTEPEVVSELMAAPFLIDNLRNGSGRIVADFYELYSWQKLISNEFLARKAIVERNYIIAERNYRRILKEEEENVEGLADLATIYDRFGQYRKEAQVYEVMRSTGTASVELDEAIEKSSAKIRPQTGIESGFLSKNGRDGLVNLENINLGASLSFTPDLEKDIKFLYLSNKYRTTEKSETISGSFLESTGTIEIFTNTDFLFAGQAERLNGKVGTNFYYFLGLRSRLDDYFSGHIEVYKKKVDDTLDAVAAGIYNDGFEVGLSAETISGLLFGGDFMHRYYSDGNSQDQFHGYSSYNLYGKDTHFSMQYDYLYVENNESNETVESSGMDPRENNLYWKPGRYTEHKMTFHFQHLIKGEYGIDGLKSYYSFDNSLAYENPQNLIYTGEFDIFLEMSPHYLLKSNLVFINSDEYEEKSIHFSLLYRW